MGSIHHMIKFIPHLCNLTARLRPPLSAEKNIRGSKLKWTIENNVAFANIKTAIAAIIAKKNLTRQNPQGLDVTQAETAKEYV